MPVTATAYTFKELEPLAQEYAVEHNRDFFDDHEWWDYVYDWWKDEKLPALGFVFEDEKQHRIMFSGFSSQGDGACFECHVDVYQFMKAHKLCNQYRSLAYWIRYDRLAWALIKHMYHTRYYHYNTMGIEAEFEYYACDNVESADRASEQLEDLSKIIIEEARDQAKKLYRALEKEYEDLTSDEHIREILEINDHIVFWTDGSRALIRKGVNNG